MEESRIHFYQTGTFTVGNRLLDEKLKTLQSSTKRFNSLESGHRACQGCGEALGARYVLDTAMEETDGRIAVTNATGCLEVFSTPYPESAWRMPWLHSLFGNAAAVATGMAAAYRVRAKKDGKPPVRVISQGGDGGTTDIGQGKSVPLIAMAHGIPYVATATVADLHDLERKVRKAMSMHGARYIQILVPCPLGWGFASDKTVEVARLAAETGIFPVFEAENGEITGSYKIRRPTPVEAYLKLQKRFAHLLGKKGDPETVARLQRMANRNIEKFGLTEEAEEHPEGLFRSLVSPKGDAESV